jgi:hypothetical protein
MTDGRLNSGKILHARTRRESFVKAPKAKILAGAKKIARKGTSPDKFKSI